MPRAFKQTSEQGWGGREQGGNFGWERPGRAAGWDACGCQSLVHPEREQMRVCWGICEVPTNLHRGRGAQDHPSLPPAPWE